MRAMTKLAEPEKLRTLKHRWGRTVEIWVAYQVFLNDEVKIGPAFTCINRDLAKQTTHTLLTCYYSYLFSLFDRSGINFEEISAELVVNASHKASEVRTLILEHWEDIRSPMTQIRNNIGFHGAVKEKGKSLGYSAYFSIHPFSSEYIMTLMRVFFRLMEEVYESAETIARQVNPGEIDLLMEQAKLTKQMIENSAEDFAIEPILTIANLDEDGNGYVN
jgi:hypothetical protein